MITTTQTAGAQMTLEGMAVKIASQFVNVPKPIVENEFDLCPFESPYFEKVFAYPTDDSDEYRNDKREVLTTLLDGSSVAEFRLVKPDGTKEVLNDNTFGEYFAPGSFVNQPLKTGFVVDWLLVFNAFGGGTYYIETSQTDFGDERITNSWDYKLQIYSEQQANLTTRIKTVHNGLVKNREDYEGMTWVRWVRVPGIFGNKTAIVEADNYESTSNQLVQIRDRVKYEYLLSVELVPSFVINTFTEDRLQANEMFVSNYALFGHEIFEDKQVYSMPSEFTPEYYTRNTKATFEMKLLDVDQSNIKYNL
jgi:hypothetical protein